MACLKRPTILQIVPELDTGGAELSAIEIAGAVVKAGGRSLVLSEGGRLAARLDACGAEFVPFPAATKNPARILWNARAIAGLIAREGVDLVHGRSRAPAWSAMIAARRTGKPFVTTFHGAYNENSRAKHLYNSVMARGDAVIANSAYTGSLVRERYAIPPERLHVVYRGIDPELLDPASIGEGRIAALRRAWDVDANTPLILLAARLSPLKDHPTAIEATRLLRDRGALGDAVMILAGDAQGRDGYLAQLEQSIAAAGLGDRMRLVGHVADIPAALKTASVTLLTSKEPETFGRTVAEAGAMGCPMIAPNIGAPPELILTGPPDAMTGWLFPPGDASRLADAIDAALRLSPDQRLALARRSRSHVVEHFSLDAMRRQTLSVYDRLLATDLARRFTVAGTGNPP